MSWGYRAAPYQNAGISPAFPGGAARYFMRMRTPLRRNTIDAILAQQRTHTPNSTMITRKRGARADQTSHSPAADHTGKTSNGGCDT